MYSIVMVAALSAGNDVAPPPATFGAPAVGWGGFSGHHHGKFHHHHSSYPGGGYACDGFSVFGVPYGLGYQLTYGASYGYSCAGTCHGGALIIYAPDWGPPPTLHGYHSGFAPLWGTGPPVAFGRRVDALDAPDNVPVMPTPVSPMSRPGSDTIPMGANLKFQVPDGTKLYVDGQPAPGTGRDREFATPPLAVGQKFCYDVRAELIVSGEKIVEEKRVVVEAGVNRTVTFSVLLAAVGRPTGIASK